MGGMKPCGKPRITHRIELDAIAHFLLRRGILR